MTRLERIKRLQAILSVTPDGIWGRRSQLAFDTLINEQEGVIHAGRASSFADPADIRAYRKAKERGATDQEAFKVGDNGIGCWGDNTAEGSGLSCALPPDDMEERWGSVNAAKHKLVEVTANNTTIVCVLKDRMPRRANIQNSAIIDLNPDSARSLGVEPPMMIAAEWKWA